MPEVPALPAASAAYSVSTEDGAWLLSGGELLGVEHLGAIWPLPGCAHPVRGLVASEQGPLALLSLAEADPQANAAATQPARLLALRTPLGPIGLAAQGVAAGASAGACAGLQTPLQGALRGFGPAATGPAARQAGGPRPAKLHFLRVGSGGAEWVVPAARVRRVGKHSGARAWQTPGHGRQWLVQLDGELLAAESLVSRLAAYPQAVDAAPADEPWCLCLDEAGSSRGLLVQQVLGLVEAEAGQLKTLDTAGQPSRWLLLPDWPPIEVLDRPGAGTPGASASASAATLPWPPDARGALSLHAGGWRLALPAAAVTTVLGPLDSGRLAARRSPCAWPALDLSRLLPADAASASATPTRRYAVLARLGRGAPGRRGVVLLCTRVEAVRPADAAAPWTPLPTLPAALHSLLQALRLGPDGAELLLRSDAAGTARRAALDDCRRLAFAGWLSPLDLQDPC